MMGHWRDVPGWVLGLAVLTATAAAGADAAPEDFRVVKMGTAVELGGGHRITLSRHEAEFRYQGVGVFDEPAQGSAEAVWVEICAGGADLENFVSSGYFGLVRPVAAGGFEILGGHPVKGVKEPLLAEGLLPETVPAGTCREGWVLVASQDHPADRPLFPGRTAVTYDNTGAGVVPAGQELKAAWRIE